MIKSIKKFVANESGVTAIEYALISSLIAVAIITALTALGPRLSTTFGEVSGNLKEVPPAGPNITRGPRFPSLLAFSAPPAKVELGLFHSVTNHRAIAVWLSPQPSPPDAGMFASTGRAQMSIDTYLTIALAASSIVAVGIALSIAGRLLVTVPTYVWRLMTGTLSATDRYWAVETGPHRRLSVLAMHGAAAIRG